MLVVDEVLLELGAGRRSGNNDADALSVLASGNHIQIVRLGDMGLEQFRDLTAGGASQTLDDGEASTVSYAIEHEAIAMIDERKANRICAERFPGLQIGCTVDMLATRTFKRLSVGKDLATQSSALSTMAACGCFRTMLSG